MHETHKKGSKWKGPTKGWSNNSLDAGNLENQQYLEVTRTIGFRNVFDHIQISH